MISSVLHDADGALSSVGDLQYSYDSQTGFLTGSAIGSLSTGISYNQYGEASRFTARYGASPVYDVQYTRDALGRIAQKSENIEGATSVYDYGYDAAGRLVSVSKDGVIISQYSYDANGNRKSHVSQAGATNGTYDAQDRMTSYGDASYSYTANGELLTKTDSTGATAYEYDEFGNLVSVALPDGTLVEYVIDGKNRRVGKKVNGVFVQGFLYKDQLNPAAELDPDGAVVSRFVYGAKPNVPEYMVKGGKTYRIVSDHLGSVRLVIDVATGTVAQRIDYDEYGKIINDTNTGFQPFGYAGGIYDQHTKLTRFGARDYDAHTGRWTSKDPIRFGGGDSNLYGYVLDDPINMLDILGLKNEAACGPGSYAYWDPDFNHCCERHDSDYKSCALGRDECDLAFLRCMFDACREEYELSIYNRVQCLTRAMALYDMVLPFGGPFYCPK